MGEAGLSHLRICISSFWVRSYCLFTCLSIYLSNYQSSYPLFLSFFLPSIHPSIRTYIHTYIYPSFIHHRSIYYLSTDWSFLLSFSHPSIHHLSIIYPSIFYLSFSLSFPSSSFPPSLPSFLPSFLFLPSIHHLSNIYLSIHLSIYLSIYLPIYLPSNLNPVPGIVLTALQICTYLILTIALWGGYHFSTPILQVGKLRNRETLANSHTASPMVDSECEPKPSGSRFSDVTTTLGLCVFNILVLWTITCSLSRRENHSSVGRNREFLWGSKAG